MGKLSVDISKVLNEIGKEDPQAYSAKRAAKVKEMWSACVEEMILEHTNSIYILKKEGLKQLIVYVDESIYAAELNARRELIKLKLLQEFNEQIDDFKILISRGNYKKNYPFRKEESLNGSYPSVPLDEEEMKEVEETVSGVENEELREKLKKAMVADLEWKKGLKREKY